MDFDAFIDAAWDEHAEQPEAVAERLPPALGLIVEAAQLPRFAALATHVLGEHLGQWQRGLDLLAELARLPLCDDRGQAALTRHAACLRTLAGESQALDTLAGDERVAALALCAGMAAGRSQFDDALAWYRQALALARPGLADGVPALRALAVAGNNLAAALEELAPRSADQTQGMLDAAGGALTYWKRAGGWLEEARAEVRLARSQLQAGQGEDARASARRSLAVCDANAAAPFEHFLGQTALALACRACADESGWRRARTQALAQHARLTDDERAWCAGEVAELGQ